MDALLGFVVAAAVGIAYFIPAMMAHQHHHPQEAAIVLVNLLLGWTGLGWIVAMVWSTWAAPIPALARANADATPDTGFCGDCGSPLEARASFCPACGYRTPHRG